MRNPDTCSHKDAVEEAIDLDLYIELRNAIHIISDKIGEFLLDAKEHFLFGTSHASASALNFLGPPLIECGFPYSRDELVTKVEEPLNEVELEYFRRSLASPRSLKLRCSNTLRK